MAGPWEDFAAQDSQGTPWTDFQAAQAQKAPPATGAPANLPMQPWKASVLPVSTDSEGGVHFDPSAGILGAIKNALTLPGDVYSGKADLNTPEGFGRAVDMAGMIAPMAPIAKVRPPISSDVAAPSGEALRSAAGAGYDTVRDSGVDYSASAVSDLAKGIRADLEKDGVLSELAPKSFGILGKLENPPPGSVAPIAGLEAARRSFGNAAKDFTNPTEQMAARRIQEGLDKFIANPDPVAVVSGPAGDAAKALTEARGNYAASKRSDQLTKVADQADLSAGAANSGQNLDNAIRQRIKGVLLNDRKAAGYSPEELDALESVVRGSRTGNALRFAGNLLGGGGGLGAVVSGGVGGAAGGALGGPVGMAIGAGVPALGLAAKKIAAGLTSRGLNTADELVRQRSPLFAQMLQDQPPVALPSAQQAALIRGLLGIGAAPQDRAQ